MRLRQDRDTTTGSVVKMRLPASNKGGFQYPPQRLDYPVRHFRAGGDIRTWPEFTVLCSRVQASGVPSTGRHLGERQMSVNFTCRPTIAAARFKLESEGL